MKHYTTSEYVILITDEGSEIIFTDDLIKKNYKNKEEIIYSFEIKPDKILVDLKLQTNSPLFCLIRYGCNLDLLPKVVELASKHNVKIDYKIEVIRHLYKVSQLFDFYNDLLDNDT